MKIKLSLPEDQINQGFSSNDDIFKQKDLALRLSSLFEQLEHGSVSLIDGRWGVGKTTFVKRWVAHLRNSNTPAIYFDAFQSDYLESPFQAVAAAFVQAANAARRTTEPAYATYLKRAAKVGKILAGTAAKVGIKAVTLGAVNAADLEDLAEIKESLSDSLGEVSEETIKKLLESHAEHEESFSLLRNALADLPDLLTPHVSEPESAATPKSLIIVIDELDRCRPDFALGVLECLKHFFRVDRLHFVLVTNREHLALSVNHRYGAGAAAEEYLEKFYDFVIYFDQNYDRYSEGSVRSFISRLSKALLPAQTEDSRYIDEYMNAVAVGYQLSLRKIEAIFTNVALSYLAYRPREYRPAILIVMLSLMKVISPKAYKDAKSGHLTLQQVVTMLGSGRWDKNWDGDRVIKIFRYHMDPNLDLSSDEWRGWDSELFRYNLERTQVIQYLANSILDRFGQSTG